MFGQESIKRMEFIYQRNRDDVVVGVKTARELLQCARDFVDLEQVAPLDRLAKRSMERFDQTLQTVFAEDETLRGKTPSYVAFVVPYTEKNAEYYADRGLIAVGEEDVLLMELHSVYFSCRSTLLYSRLRRAAGISPEDLAARNEEFVTYMMQSFLDDPANPIHDKSPADGVVSVCIVPVETDPETPDTPKEAAWREEEEI